MMQGLGEGASSFWKKNSRNVPGRPSPKKDGSKNRLQKRYSNPSSFQDFQESVDDAWDIGDDDFCVISDVKVSKKVIQSTAMSVIHNHQTSITDEVSEGEGMPSQKNSALSHTVEVTLSDERRAEAMQRLACQREVPSPSHKSAPQMIHGPVGHRSYPGRPHPLADYGYQAQADYGYQAQLSTVSKSNERESVKLEKFQSNLEGPNTDLEELRALSWSGTPVPVRATSWKILSGYLPANGERRQQALERKRVEYWNFVKQYYNTRLEDIHQDTYRQIHTDIPRMSPLIALFQQSIVQEIFERILYIWAIRHPASGYVQGINDLVTPFFVVFLQDMLAVGEDPGNCDISALTEEQRNVIEADSFWCLSKLLDGIQDNYTFAQPGIQQKVNQLKELIQRIDAPLHEHLVQHEVDYLQFSFRWMNNLLMRELPLHCTIRLWDTYLSEPEGFASFHLYVCAAFLACWRKELLRERDFQGLMLLLQNLPTQHWGNSEISLLVADAFRLKYMFADAPNHLQSCTR